MQRFGLLLALAIVCTIAASASDLQINIINRHHMVSLSSFAEKFGATVDYDTERDGINLTLHDHHVTFIPYNQTAWVDGRAVILDQPVVIVDDVTYLPLRFMCESFALGYTCNDDDTQVVVVDSCTNETFFLAVDWGWCDFCHVWCYDFDCRGYRNWHYDHNVDIVIHPGGGNYWNHSGYFAGGSAWNQGGHQYYPYGKTSFPSYSGRTLNTTARIPLYQRASSSHNWNNSSSGHSWSNGQSYGGSHDSYSGSHNSYSGSQGSNNGSHGSFGGGSQGSGGHWNNGGGHDSSGGHWGGGGHDDR